MAKWLVTIFHSAGVRYPAMKDRFQATDNWPAIRPSGAFVSTALDMAKWALQSDRILISAYRKR
jgi:hypothetical protein